MIDNACTFFNWVVKGEVQVAELSDKAKKVSFAASSPRPNAKEVWNKNYFVGFGDIAFEIEKKVKPNSIVTIVAVQQPYVDSQKRFRQNFKVLEISVLPQPKNKEQRLQTNPTTGEQKSPTKEVSKPADGNIHGYDDMMSFMRS